jgi:hypothetical protein
LQKGTFSTFAYGLTGAEDDPSDLLRVSKPREPLCQKPFSQVTSDRGRGRETLS